MRYYFLYARCLAIMTLARCLGLSATMTPWESIQAAWDAKAELLATYYVKRQPCQCADCVANRLESQLGDMDDEELEAAAKAFYQKLRSKDDRQ